MSLTFTANLDYFGPILTVKIENAQFEEQGLDQSLLKG